MVAVPIMGLAFLSGWGLYQGLSHIRASLVGERELDLAEKVSGLVFDLQVERGLAMARTSQDGTGFDAALQEQREKVDAAVAGFRRDATAFHAQGHEGLSRFLTALAGLQGMRDRLTDAGVSAAETGASYTTLIRSGLQLTEEALNAVPSAEIVRLAAGVIALSEVRESAGLEQGLGMAGFARGGFDPSTLQDFVGHAVAQDSALRQAELFLQGLDKPVRLREAAEARAVQDLRDVARSAAMTGDLKGVSADRWHETSGSWIRFLREEQLAFVDVMHTSDATLMREAIALLAVVSALSALVLLYSTVYARIVIRVLNRRIAGLRQSFAQLADKRLDFAVPYLDDSSEMGELCRALESTRANLHAIETREEAERNAQGMVVDLLGEALKQLARQDLTCRIDVAFAPRFEGLRSDFNAAVEQLSEVLGEVDITVGGLHRNASSLSDASERLALRTETQAATLEETSAAFNQISGTAGDIASHAEQAERAVSDASREAGKGGATAQKALEAMQRISQSSREMTEIVHLIEELGFQTNLLALNAGVEAARAGESGRGFAVVASEVRMLAQRATDATDRIKKLIGASSEQVASGVTLVEQTDSVLSSIVQKVADVSEKVGRIRDDSKDQASTMGEINAATRAMAEITEKNAAMADDARGLCRELQGHGSALQGQIRGFTLRPSYSTAEAEAAGWRATG